VLIRATQIFTALAALFLAATANAQNVNWEFQGTITDNSNYSTLPIGTQFTLTVDFDPNQTGVGVSGATNYLGDATFTSLVDGFDTSALIRINAAPNTLLIELKDPDASLPQVEYTNLPGQFNQVEWIALELLDLGVGTEDIQDYLTLALPADSTDRYILVTAPGSAAITGEVTAVESTSSTPVPNTLLPLLLPPVLVAMGTVTLRKGVRA